MAIRFKHMQTGLIRKCPEGFSFTYMFFGPIIGIIRGMWTPFFVSFFTFGLANLYYMFVINKHYAAVLLERGFSPENDDDHSKLVRLKLLTASSALDKAV